MLNYGVIFHFPAAINNSKRNIYMQTLLLLPRLSVILNSCGGARGFVNEVINCRWTSQQELCPPNFSKFYWNVKVSSSKELARGPLMSLWMTTLPLVSAGAGPGLQGRWGSGEGSRHQEAGLPGSSQPQPGWDVNVFESISASGLCRSHTSAWKTNRPLSGSKHHQNLNAKVLLGHRHTFFFLLPWECLKKFFFLVLQELVTLKNHSYSCYILATQCSSLRHSIHPIACKICSRIAFSF